MTTTVVTIARTLGAGGELIGRAVADQLRFRYVDEEIISIAAEKENLDPAVIADVERRKSLLTRLLDAFAAGPSLESAALGGMMIEPGLYFPHGFGTIERLPVNLPEHYRELIRQAIVETARVGSVVIHAHAAGMTLAGSEGLLRVLVTAPVEMRIRRLVESTGATPKDAEKTIRDSDRDRRDYFQRFHAISDEQPTDYDLVVNTDVLSPEIAVRTIISAAAL